MKKIIKSTLSLMLAFVLIIPVFLLTGCSKKYTINVKISAGEGSVLLQQESMIAGTSKSVVGNNAVEEGAKFEFLIKPATGYEIKSIKEDGVLVETGYDKKGTYRSFVDVKANHKVEVEFQKEKFAVTFKCKDGSNNWVDYKVVENIEYNSEINLNDAIYGGTGNKNWYKNVNGAITYFYNDNSDPNAAIPSYYTADSNILVVKTNWTIYTTKTADEIPAVA